MNTSIFRVPSALLPIAMSLAALGVMVGHLAMAGAAGFAADDSTAYVFQLLLVCQVPVVAFFSIKWLPRLPAEAMMMIGLQAGAAMLALVPVVMLGL